MLVAAAVTLPSAAQFRAPQPERKTPRAIGVLETFKNGTRRLLPVTFFYQRHYYDAGLYRAAPVPFTLYSETVYEVQQYGKPLGTFTIQSATANTPLNDVTETRTLWFGNGKFRAAREPALAKKVEPVKIEDPTRPVLHRREGGEGDTATGASAPPITPPEVENDPDRPKLHKRADSQGDANSTQTASAQTSADKPDSSQQDPNRPKLTRHDGSEVASQAGVVNANLTPSDDPDHPVLRRGKPVQAQGGHDLPDFKIEEPVARQVAVSDAGSSGEPAELIFVCTEQERQQLEEQARELARAELQRVAAQRGLKLPAPAKAAEEKLPASMAKKHAVAKAPELPLTDEQFIPFDLEYNNYATVVFSARYTPESETAAAASAGAAPATPTAVARGRSWVVTVVARQDENKLVKLYSAVSDPRELDLYPEVRLVDAVDPEGYGHFQLLFREKKRDGVSWLLGRATGYELQTVFETAER